MITDIERKIAESFDALANTLDSYFGLEPQIMAMASFKTGASGSPEIVTDVDKEIEEISIRFLSSSFPDIPIFSEERYKEGSCLPDHGWVFIIDPIDGTSEFVRGSSEWSVSVAAVNNLSPRGGMLFLPQEKLRFSAIKGNGLFLNDKALQERAWVEQKSIAVSPRQIQIPELNAKIRQSGYRPLPVATLTIKIVSLLLGRVDAAVYFPQEGKSANVWDYAAALVLIEEFGGKMTSLDGAAMPFDGQRIIHKDGWLASKSFCNHAEILKTLR